MSDYLGSFSSWGNPSMPWNPQIDSFGAAPSPTSELRLAAAPNYTSALNDLGTPLPGAVNPGFMDSLRNWGVFDKTTIDPTGARLTTQGWGMPTLAAGQGLFNAWMGMKQYGLFKDQLAENKRQFGLNYDAQVRTTNSALEDRQRARVASNPGAYQSVGDYMAANRVGG